MHHLRKDIRSLPPAKVEEFMKRPGNERVIRPLMRPATEKAPSHDP
jgi:hypothetical protein